MTKQTTIVLVIAVLAVITRFWNLSYPQEIIFDEVHFGKFVSAYFTHEYYFDIHPPLGKLLVAAAAQIAHLDLNQPKTTFDHIGQTLNKRTALVLRLLPALFGVFLIVLVYKLIIEFGVSEKTAFWAALLMIFENALLVQSKFMLIDVFLLFFGFLAIYFFALHYKSDRHDWLFPALAGLSAGLATSVKMTGLFFVTTILAGLLIDAFLRKAISKAAIKCVAFLLAAIFAYAIPFQIHFNLLYKSGDGDAFMSKNFQAGLLGSKITENAPALSFWQKFKELNMVMYESNANLKASHPDGSRWYEWPFLRKPVWYWTKNLDKKTANIYFLGNPFVWLMVLASVAFASYKILRKKILGEKFFPVILILVGYYINLFAFLFVHRVSFLYHYLISLVFGVIMTALLLDELSTNSKTGAETRSLQNKIYIWTTLGTLLAFLIIAPLSYGLPVGASAHAFYNALINVFRY